MYPCEMYCLRSLRRAYWCFDLCDGLEDSGFPRTLNGRPELDYFKCAHLLDLSR
uniref:Uncharacterized protein n=1 Tax=Arundo donax TaxID=35708 RepID=A0A0A9DA35_ARUDO